jgi:hypothetical protein
VREYFGRSEYPSGGGYLEAFQIVVLSWFSRFGCLRAGGRPTISRRRGLCLIYNHSKRGLQVAGLQAVTKNFQHFLPKNLEVWNWPPYVWPCNVSTTNQQKRMKILNTINPHPTRAAHDGRYRREHSTKTWGSSRGQKANRSKRAADAMPCQFMRDAAKARTYDERRAKRKRTA